MTARHLSAPLAALTALLATLAIGASPTPAHTNTEAQNGVGASTLAAPTHTGPPTPQTPSTRPGSITKSARITAGCCVAPKAAADDALRALPRGRPELIQEGLEHIVHRHGPMSGWRGKSKFAPGTGARDLRSMIDEATQRGTFRPNTRGRPGHIYEHRFGGPIGTSGGRSTSNLRVVVDPNGSVVTAFPYRP